MLKESKELFREFNKGIAEFKKVGVIPEEIKKYQRAIDMIYKRNDVTHYRKGKFKLTNVSPKVEQELLNVAKAMSEDKSVLFLADYEEMFKRKDFKQYKVKSVADVIQMKSKIDEVKSDREVMASMTYEHYIDIIRKSEKVNYTGDIRELTLQVYQDTGLTGNRLFRKVTKELNDYAKMDKDEGQTEQSAQKTKKRQF